MKYKKTLSGNLAKMQFLSGLKHNLLNEVNTQSSDSFDFEDKTNELEKDISNEVKNTFGTSHYLQTNENELLGFPEKISMLIGNANSYLKILEKICYSLYIKEGLSAGLFDLKYLFDDGKMNVINQKIINNIKIKLTPTITDNVKNIDQIINSAINNIKIKRDNLKVDTIKKVNSDKEFTEFKTLQDKIKKLQSFGIDDEFVSFLKSEQEKLKRDNYPTASGDEKATISYNFKARANESKLKPKGFWQIQFLSRVAANQPQNELEEILFGNGKYIGHALKTLENFYKAAFHNIIAMLTGRKFQINPNDHEFMIIKDKAWDKVKDNLVSGKFDTKKQNFGAWAFTVAKNATIDEIKKITDLYFESSSEVAMAMETNKIDSLSFKKPIDIPQEYLKSINPEDNTYIFKSPYHIVQYINEISTKNNGKLSQSWLLNLSNSTRKTLHNIGALKSIKKFSDFYQDEQGEEEFDKYSEKATGEERDETFKELATLYLSTSKMSITNKKLPETVKLQSITNENGEQKYSNEEIESAFKRDLGKALYFYQAEFIKNMPTWSRRPPQSFQDAFLAYAKSAEVPSAESSLIKSVNANDAITNPIFFQDQDNKKELLTFSFNDNSYNIGDYAYYKETSAIGKHYGIPEQIKNEFYSQQIDNKQKNELTYTFEGKNDLWGQIQDGVSAMNINKKKQDKRRTDFEYTKKEENKIASIFLGALINSPKIHDKEIRTYIFNFLNSKFKKLNLPNDISDNELLRVYQEKKSYFYSDSEYKKMLISKYKLEEKAKKYLYNEYTRTKELNALSNKLSKLSGFEIQLEQNNVTINEIQNYLIETNKNIFKKTIQ